MQENISTPKISGNFPGLQFEVINVKIFNFLMLLLLAVLFFNQHAIGKVAIDNGQPLSGGVELFTDSTESSAGINLPNINTKPPTHHNEANTTPPPTIPELVFCFNDTPATEGSSFELCATTQVEFSLCEIIDGVAPFTICFDLDSDANCVSGIEAGDVILAEELYPGNHNLKITSVIDATGNSSPYTDNYSYTIEVTNPPVADAGNEATICEATGLVLNSASAESYSSIIWNGGDGTFIPSPEVLNPMYLPGPNDGSKDILGGRGLIFLFLPDGNTRDTQVHIARRDSGIF